MATRRPLAILLVALVALLFGFLVAAQLRAQLIVPGNRLARNEALVRSVQDLERSNQDERARVAALRGEVAGLETDEARRSDDARRLAQQVNDLRAHAGLTALHGPGVSVGVANGRPGPDLQGRTAYLVSFEDIQDVVNVLFAGGAEAVAVNGRRVTPGTAFAGSGDAVVVDQSGPLASPFRVVAVGDRGRMEQVLADPAALGNLRDRSRRYGLELTVAGSPDLSVPASDSSLEPRFAEPA